MAALVFIGGSVIEQIYRVGCVFVRTQGSIAECWNFIITERNEFLIEKYLKQLDTDTSGIRNKTRSNVKSAIMNEEDEYIEEFCHIDEADVGQGSAINSQLIQEAGLVFSCSTLGEVTPGTSFYITGIILKNCERFSINLTLGVYSSDIALHINPRLPQNYIVRNSKIHNIWGKEEVTSALPFSLNRGDSFAIQILVTESDYFISINGKHYAAFKHRIPYSRVTTLQVKGDVTDIEVEQLSVMEYPDRLPDQPIEYAKECEELSENEELEYLDREIYLDLPYCGKLPTNLKHGTNLHVIGRVKQLPHSFYINLQKGDKIWPHPTIAFHLNPRFANVGGQHVMCRNSWLDNKWDREERSEIKSGFMPGKKFHLLIMCADSAYHVFLNRKFIAEYEYRIDPSVVDTIYIQGDLKLHAVLLETKPVTQFLGYNCDL